MAEQGVDFIEQMMQLRTGVKEVLGQLISEVEEGFKEIKEEAKIQSLATTRALKHVHNYLKQNVKQSKSSKVPFTSSNVPPPSSKPKASPTVTTTSTPSLSPGREPLPEERKARGPKQKATKMEKHKTKMLEEKHTQKSL